MLRVTTSWGCVLEGDMSSVDAEVADFLEHFDRYRSVTLQVLDLVTDEQLAWRPGSDYYSLCQQLLHIAQAEDYHAHGLFENEWNPDRVRLPKECWSRDRVRSFCEDVRGYTRPRVVQLTRADMDSSRVIPGMDGTWTVRSWLWFILEHELHHKGQIWLYLRQMGLTPPFYAMPLPVGERPDIAARRELGGF